MDQYSFRPYVLAPLVIARWTDHVANGRWYSCVKSKLPEQRRRFFAVEYAIASKMLVSNDLLESCVKYLGDGKVS